MGTPDSRPTCRTIQAKTVRRDFLNDTCPPVRSTLTALIHVRCVRGRDRQEAREGRGAKGLGRVAVEARLHRRRRKPGERTRRATRREAESHRRTETVQARVPRTARSPRTARVPIGEFSTRHFDCTGTGCALPLTRESMHCCVVPCARHLGRAVGRGVAAVPGPDGARTLDRAGSPDAVE